MRKLNQTEFRRHQTTFSVKHGRAKRQTNLSVATRKTRSRMKRGEGETRDQGRARNIKGNRSAPRRLVRTASGRGGLQSPHTERTFTRFRISPSFPLAKDQHSPYRPGKRGGHSTSLLGATLEHSDDFSEQIRRSLRDVFRSAHRCFFLSRAEVFPSGESRGPARQTLRHDRRMSRSVAATESGRETQHQMAKLRARSTTLCYRSNFTGATSPKVEYTR